MSLCVKFNKKYLKAIESFCDSNDIEFTYWNAEWEHDEETELEFEKREDAEKVVVHLSELKKADK